MPFAVKCPSQINRKPITPQSRADDAGSTHLKLKSSSQINQKPITPQSRADDAGSTHLKRKRASRSRNSGRF
ncbi:hypothetical protein CDAR_501261 [Caerostris darwini]|uniref:Uncharacterized protein n=1 Tax=Caerostris darwini TaxID=1538125 RepID=A0AAV4R7G2_9ARAC|nr:hypothetical protein CDAR_501261 [Caerostris darwini]